jgi:hypothetical protein
MAAYRIKYCGFCDRSTDHDISGACMECGKTAIDPRRPKFEERIIDAPEPAFNSDTEFARWRASWKQKLFRDSHIKDNAFFYGENETDNHCEGKWHVIDKFIDKHGIKNLNFLTEVRSADRRFRADVVMFVKGMDAPVVCEVPVNETPESLENKRKFWTGQGFSYEVREWRHGDLI